jgi:hypothetical protein
LYDCLRVITFIISRFSNIVFSCIRQSYKILLSMTSIKRTRTSSMFVRVAFNIEQHQIHKSSRKVQAQEHCVSFSRISLRINVIYLRELHLWNKWRDQSVTSNHDYSRKMNREISQIEEMIDSAWRIAEFWSDQWFVIAIAYWVQWRCLSKALKQWTVLLEINQMTLRVDI